MLRKLVYLALLFSNVSCIQGNRGHDAEVASQQDQPQAGLEADTARPLPPETIWTAEYEQISAVPGLSDQEKAKLKAALEARAEALTEWRTEEGAELAQFEQQMKQTAEARDLTGLRAAKAKAEPLRDELRELLETHRSNIREALSPKHQLEWEAHQVSERVLDLMQPLDLSDQQISQVRTEALSTVRTSVNESNPGAAAYLKLEQTLEVSVLTAEQRQAFQEIKRKNPLRSLQ
jgi:hypothetical protein